MFEPGLKVEVMGAAGNGWKYAGHRTREQKLYPPSKSESVFKALIDKVNESNEHIYGRLEAAAGRARHNEEHGWSFINQCLRDEYL